MKPPLFSCLTSRITNNGSLYGRFLLGPLPIDLSLTVATVLRRSLLHNVGTFTIVSAEIEGAYHEYASLPGIQESILEILLNLGEVVLTCTQRNFLNSNFRTSKEMGMDGHESVAFNKEPTGHGLAQRAHSRGTNPTMPTPYYFASINISGPCTITAKDINWPKGIFCVKPDAVICTLSSNETFHMRLKIEPSAFFLKKITNEGSGQIEQKEHQKDLFSKNIAADQDSLTSLKKIKENTFEESSQKIDQKENTLNTLSNFSNDPLEIGSIISSSVEIQNYSPLSSYCLRKRQRAQQKNLIEKSITREYSANEKNTLSLAIFENNSENKSNVTFQVFPQKVNTFFSSGNNTLSKVLEKETRVNFLDSKNTKQLKIKNNNFVNNQGSSKAVNLPIKKSVPLSVKSSSYPVEKVNFLIERDDELAGYRHRIILEVWTNGSISPRQAIFDSLGSLIKLIYSFREPVRNLFKSNSTKKSQS